MAMATRAAGDKECDGSKSDGDDENGCRRGRDAEGMTQGGANDGAEGGRESEEVG